MRIVVIGGTGHIGTFLVPRLVRGGHEVVSISRGARSAYLPDPEWAEVEQLRIDREQEDRAGTFAGRIAGLDADVVIDLVCFTRESAGALVDGLRGSAAHLIHCGSIWRYGPSAVLPIREGAGTPPLGHYGVEKDAIARLLRAETADGGLVTTSLHPGHIVGPGWVPVNPLGNLDPMVWATIAAGKPLRVPGLGTELLHHVHADDVAQAFERAVEHRDAAAGEDFNVTSACAVTVRGFAQEAASWFDRSVQLEHVSWEEFRRGTGDDAADASWDHLLRSHCVSIEKARASLGYEPAYTSFAAVHESVRWLIEHGRLDVGGRSISARSSR